MRAIFLVAGLLATLSTHVALAQTVKVGIINTFPVRSPAGASNWSTASGCI